MDRKAIARETMKIMEQGYYELPAEQGRGKAKRAGENQKPEAERIFVKEAMERSVRRSILLSPDQGTEILEKYKTSNPCNQPETRVENISTVEAIHILSREGKTDIGVLNFASAKNPGGGFLNGAMAQEESLAASGGLYKTLTPHEEYYRRNRACGHMRYTGCAIWSPEVVFFRDDTFALLPAPVTASVLTLPAVNLGQVIQKGEDLPLARRTMKARMERALALFAAIGARELVLGAYGCGVFRNDPGEIARWWRELLDLPAFGGRFAGVTYAVLDHSKNQSCLRAFLEEERRYRSNAGKKQG